MKSQRLPDAEFDIMEMIWDSTPPITTAMVWEGIGREKGVKIQTIVTLFGRLVDRGFLRYERGKGREREFYPLISREEYLQMETENFVSHYHKRSYTSLLNALHREQLSNDDLDELAQWIKEARNDRNQEG